MPLNWIWAANGFAMVFLVSNSRLRPPGFDKEAPSPTHSLNAGADCGYFALQANKMGWHVHGMAGFDRERTVAELILPAGYRTEAAYAVGRVGDPSGLAEELRGRVRPGARTPLTQLVFEGSFSA